ncbi:MAG: alpha-N-arabinofuranosidase [bacterium]|jgi:alpha-N-arabinofuranosidase
MLKRSVPLLLLAALAIAAASAQTGSTPGQRIAVTIDASKTAPPISPYIYGQFIEHIGDLVNRSMWAEMLDDRKFYYPVTSAQPQQQAATSRAMRGRRANRWVPIGPDSSVTMDTKTPWVGDHSPVITLDGAEPRGIRQAGLVLRKGKEYTGRVVLAADRGAKVVVSLVWGDAPGDRQTIPISKANSTYTRFPLKFTAGADTNNGRIEIYATGQGTFRVGAVSLMPADNIRGFRPDIMALLRDLRTGMWRFPGGNFLSAHDWKDAIGDPDKRPPIWDPVWSAVQPNDVGTDEFLTMCELLGVDAFISVNAGFGEARSAAELVEYVNGSADTPMGKLRAANGHPAPYNVKWWGIGNEMYGTWQFGHMALEQYVIKHNMFAKAMKKVDPTIKLLATGATPEEMTIYGISQRLIGKQTPDFGSAADWTGGLLTHCLDNIDIMSEHFYSYANQRYDLKQARRIDIKEDLLDWVRRPANRVRNKVEAYEEYYKRIPAAAAKRVPMALDEWAYTRSSGNNLMLQLAHAMVFHEMFRHSGLIIMAGHTMGTGAIDFNETEAALNTTGLLFKLYRDHFGTVPVEVSGTSPVPGPKYPVGGDQPRINAGSPTYPVDVSAALTEDGKALTIAVINPTESVQELALDVKGIQLQPGGKSWRMWGPSLTSVTGLNSKDVQISQEPANDPALLRVAPHSIVIYEFARR